MSRDGTGLCRDVLDDPLEARRAHRERRHRPLAVRGGRGGRRPRSDGGRSSRRSSAGTSTSCSTSGPATPSPSPMRSSARTASSSKTARCSRRSFKNQRPRLPRRALCRARRARATTTHPRARSLRRPSCARRSISRASARPSTLHRMHPILNLIRAHKGVDYAAPIGTPVHAAGDGRIRFAGPKGGYGNVVEIEHSAASSRSTATCRALRTALASAPRDPGDGDRLCRHDRPCNRPAPPLRIPGQRRVQEPAERAPARCRCRSTRAGLPISRHAPLRAPLFRRPRCRLAVMTLVATLAWPRACHGALSRHDAPMLGTALTMRAVITMAAPDLKAPRALHQPRALAARVQPARARSGFR